MLPIVDSNPRPDALIEQVLPAYRLGVISRCRLHTRGINDTFRIETADEVFFLRVYRHGWRGREEIDTELTLLRHLITRGGAGGRHRVGGGRVFGIALVVGLPARCGREEGGEALPFGAVEWRERRAVRPRERRPPMAAS